MKTSLCLQPIYLTHINSEFSGVPVTSFAQWKARPCNRKSEHCLWGVFRTNETQFCLGVSKFARNNAVFVDYRLWNVTGGKFVSVLDKVGLFDNIKDMTLNEFWEHCSDTVAEFNSCLIEQYINKTAKED